MDAYHQYWAYRLDVRQVPDRLRRDRLREGAHAIYREKYGTDGWLQDTLEDMGDSEPDAEMDLLVHEPDRVSWSLWSLQGGNIEVYGVRFRAAGVLEVAIHDAWWQPELPVTPDAIRELRTHMNELCSERLSDSKEGISFPYHWDTEARLRRAALLAASYITRNATALAFVGIGSRDMGLRIIELAPGEANVARLEPMISNPARAHIFLDLWHGGSQELGLEDAGARAG